MAVADGRGVLIYKDMGLVSQVFDEATLATLQGHLAIGHTRYSTTGDWENAQPAFKTSAAGGGVALAHNGNLTNTAAPAGTGPDRGLCTACFTGSYPIPIPDAAGPDLMPSAATQPSTLPLPNP
jgi:amidophosphoribosyltransferase